VVHHAGITSGRVTSIWKHVVLRDFSNNPAKSGVVRLLGNPGSASYAYDNSIPYLNDGIDPVNSADRGNNAFRLHPHKGTEEWVTYEFDQPRKLSSVKVYWPEDGSYTLPVSWRLSYQKADGRWAPVDSYSPYLIEKDQYNEVTFVAVTTKRLRIDLELSDAGPGGIIEWKVN